jgi:hypothetical protein
VAFEWAYTQAFHQRFKNKFDPRVEQTYNNLLYILSHTKSDTVAAQWIGVHRSTIARWKKWGFTIEQIDHHALDIERAAFDVSDRLQAEYDRLYALTGSEPIVETRPVGFWRPGPGPTAPAQYHVFTQDMLIERLWKIMQNARSLWWTKRYPVFTSFYFTIKFGSKYQGMFWNGDKITKRPTSKDDSGVYIEGGQTYNTKLDRLCADLHMPIQDLYECLTDSFYQPDTQIIRVVFGEMRTGYEARFPTIKL